MRFQVSIQRLKLYRKALVIWAVISLLPIAFLLYMFYKTIPPYARHRAADFIQLGLISVVLLSLAGFLLLVFSLKPIRTLSHNVEEALDDLGSTRPPADLNTDEIDHLSQAFGKILTELRKKVAELEDYSELLSVANKQLLEMSIVDELTGLFNFRHYKLRLAEEMSRSARYHRELSLILLDIDDFKAVNDSFGHLTGDLVLKQLGGLIASSIRKCDIAARYGGEEFVVILPETELKAGVILAQRLRRTIAEHRFPRVDDPGAFLNITVSVGVSSCSAGAADPDEFFRRTDACLIAAKKRGKNRVVFVHPSKAQPETVTTQTAAS